MSAAEQAIPVFLYGHLGERFGHEFRLMVSSPAEAIRACCAVIPGFMEAFREGSYQVLVGDEPQTLETIPAPCGHLDISIVPVVAGGKSDLMQVFMGAALLVAAYFTAGTSLAWMTPALTGLGTSMVLGGVSRMLAGSPNVGGPDTADAQNGSFFSGPENTVQQGGCIPVGYGEMLIGSIVISAGTNAEAYPCSAGGGPFGRNGGAWTKIGNVWSNGGDGATTPLCLGVDPS